MVTNGAPKVGLEGYFGALRKVRVRLESESQTWHLVGLRAPLRVPRGASEETTNSDLNRGSGVRRSGGRKIDAIVDRPLLLLAIVRCNR